MLQILQFKMCYLCATPTHLYLTIWRGCFEGNTFSSTMGKRYKRKRKITLEQVLEHHQKNAQSQPASAQEQKSIQQQIEKRRAERAEGQRPLPMPLPGHFVLPHSPTQPSIKPAPKPPPRPLLVPPYSPTTGPQPLNRGGGPQRPPQQRRRKQRHRGRPTKPLVPPHSPTERRASTDHTNETPTVNVSQKTALVDLTHESPTVNVACEETPPDKLLAQAKETPQTKETPDSLLLSRQQQAQTKTTYLLSPPEKRAQTKGTTNLQIIRSFDRRAPTRTH